MFKMFRVNVSSLVSGWHALVWVGLRTGNTLCNPPQVPQVGDIISTFIDFSLEIKCWAILNICIFHVHLQHLSSNSLCSCFLRTFGSFFLLPIHMLYRVFQSEGSLHFSFSSVQSYLSFSIESVGILWRCANTSPRNRSLKLMMLLGNEFKMRDHTLQNISFLFTIRTES